jgi:hypothetical protein
MHASIERCDTGETMQADLHVHSRYSTRPSQWFLQKIGCPESFTEPLHLYQIARRRGMTLVTITDHNRIDGALEIAHLPGTFISEEVTSYFPEDGCKLHVLVYDITEAQHAEIQKLRGNVYELAAYLKGAGICFAAAHPLYAVNDRLRPAHIEKMLLLFRILELNGDSHPDTNRALESIVAGLDPAAMARLAERHRLEPLWAEPWVKILIGGSDDHSSLSIARNFTRVPGAASAAEFFGGIRDGRAEVVQRPSSPQNLAHNLMSIAYQFYRHKLHVNGGVPHDFLLRFIDRSLRLTDEEDSGLWSRLTLLWRLPRLRRITGSIPEPLVELLKKECGRLIQEEPGLFVLPRAGDRIPQGLEARWFHFINRISNRILSGCANHLMGHFSGANLFSIFHTIGSAGGFATLLAPYFVGFALHSAQRRFARELLAHFDREAAPGPPETAAVFADTLEEARAAAGAAAPAVVLTCAGGGGDGVQSFTPIGVYEFSDLPEHRIAYPPLLEMLDWCFAHDIRRIHLAGTGPTALAGLFIARFLKLPVEATFSDALPRLARVVTHDGFIEDLAWKYVAWFCNQTAAVHAPSVEARRTLREKGVAPEKILLSNPPPAAARDAAPEGGAAEPPAAQRGSRAAGR